MFIDQFRNYIPRTGSAGSSPRTGPGCSETAGALTHIADEADAWVVFVAPDGSSPPTWRPIITAPMTTTSLRCPSRTIARVVRETPSSCARTATSASRSGLLRSRGSLRRSRGEQDGGAYDEDEQADEE